MPGEDNAVEGDVQLGAAQWEIWPPDAASELSKWLKKEYRKGRLYYGPHVQNAKGVKNPNVAHPMFDQCFFLTQHDLQRCFEETGVKAFSFLQCKGEAVFIPAGAPHQVRNLQVRPLTIPPLTSLLWLRTLYNVRRFVLSSLGVYKLYTPLKEALLIHLCVQNCIKVAVDFVSPEGILECFKLLEYMRKLPDGHAAKEDKLQVRWIMIAIVGLHGVNA